MPEYHQTVTFTREFHITAANAAEATSKMEREIDMAEFSSDVRCEGYYPFEDEEPEIADEEDES